ncbi:DUF5641 domain-containing protein [Trichonephila clavipes]|nr:DUF5641 domain-containing protein [Trichonephila clavipes]
MSNQYPQGQIPVAVIKDPDLFIIVRAEKAKELDLEELKKAEQLLLRLEQKEEFKVEMNGIQNSAMVPSNSRVKTLNPFIDSEGILRVGGRLRNSRSITSIVEPDLTNLNENRLDSWQKITKIIQLIWKRWSVDYLNSLQQRNKWHFEKKNAKIGDMVIIKEDNLPS